MYLERGLLGNRTVAVDLRWNALVVNEEVSAYCIVAINDITGLESIPRLLSICTSHAREKSDNQLLCYHPLVVLSIRSPLKLDVR